MGSEKVKVLIVEDDSQISALLSAHLTEAGFAVTVFSDGEKGFNAAKTGAFPLVLLDLMLPTMSGLEICRGIRSSKVSCRIMMLTNRAEEIDKVLGLELGADDYLAKPFSVREVVARCKALLRRDGQDSEAIDAAIVIDNLAVYPGSRDVMLDGKKISLTSTEFDLLSFMAKNAGRAYSRDQLLHAVWGYSSSAYEHTVNTHVNRLRSKIESNAANPRFIQTVWGVGYKCATSQDIRNSM